MDAGWTAGDGDILDVVATLKVTAGINPDYSLATSPRSSSAADVSGSRPRVQLPQLQGPLSVTIAKGRSTLNGTATS